MQMASSNDISEREKETRGRPSTISVMIYGVIMHMDH